MWPIHTLIGHHDLNTAPSHPHPPNCITSRADRKPGSSRHNVAYYSIHLIFDQTLTLTYYNFSEHGIKDGYPAIPARSSARLRRCLQRPPRKPVHAFWVGFSRTSLHPPFTLLGVMGTDKRQYTTVPQSDDVELHAHTYAPPSSEPEPSQSPETFAQTITNILRPKPQAHVHCEACDVQTAARQRRENEKYCCTMVATTFMTLFVCGMLLGIVIVGANAKRRRHEG
jgi:hypothetical protein